MKLAKKDWIPVGGILAVLTVVSVIVGVGAVRSLGNSQAAPTNVQMVSQSHAPAVPREHTVSVPDGCSPKAVACVDTRLRISWIQQNGKVVYGPVPVMPGSPGTPGAEATPQGVYKVEWKDKDHVSDEFDEPMTDAVFFAPGGVAFHVGPLTTSSHGCVHLTTADADYYYAHLPVGAQVEVFGGQAESSKAG